MQRAFTVPGTLLWDEDNQYVILISPDNAILAAMSYFTPHHQHARVNLVASTKGRQGLGYRIYLATMAAMHPFTLSADDCSVSGNSIRIWEQLFKCDGINKEPLFGTSAYQPEIEQELFEELRDTNPEIPLEQWDEWLDDDRMQVNDGKAFINVLLSEQAFMPHMYNMGFSLTDELAAQIKPLIKPVTLSIEQLDWVSKFLTSSHHV